eukprot:5056054-Pyramimonas_sp.AAC.1
MVTVTNEMAARRTARQHEGRLVGPLGDAERQLSSLGSNVESNVQLGCLEVAKRGRRPRGFGREVRVARQGRLRRLGNGLGE